MPRASNAIDFWRGGALVTIFINHVPGIYYERFTHRNYSISDSADLFVFLAGWALRIVVERSADAPTTLAIVAKLSERAFKIYVAQILISAVALAMLATAAQWFNDPLILEWHNAAAVFYSPIEAHIGLVLLSHQLGYFDILPLYVVLMVLAPVIALVHRRAPLWLLPASAAIYLAVLVSGTNLPSWPTQGYWFFNPLAWQLVFVLGFCLAEPIGVGALVRRNIGWFRIVALPIVVGGFVILWWDLWPDPTRVWQPRLLFVADKSFMTPMRLVQFMALAALGSFAYPQFAAWSPRLVGLLSLLGRNSLNVFCVGSLLSLAGQIIRYIFNGSIRIDTIILVCGVLLLWLTAKVSEWRETSASKGSSRS